MPRMFSEASHNCGALHASLDDNRAAQGLGRGEIKPETIVSSEKEDARAGEAASDASSYMCKEDVQCHHREVSWQESAEDRLRGDAVMVQHGDGEQITSTGFSRSESLDSDAYFVDARASLSTSCSMSGVSVYDDADVYWDHCSDESSLTSVRNRSYNARARADREIDCDPRCGRLAPGVNEEDLCAAMAAGEQQGWRAPSSSTWDVQSISSEAEEILLHAKHGNMCLVDRRATRTPLRRLLAESEEGQGKMNGKLSSSNGGASSGNGKKAAGGWDSGANSAKSKTRSLWSHCICCA